MGQATAGHHYPRERRAAREDEYERERWEPLMGSGEDTVDNLLYHHNLVEMIPFVVDSGMQDQQPTRSFPRHASLVYTPTPSREAWPFKKTMENPTKGKQGRGQLSGKRSELKDSSLWDNTENILHDDQNLYAEEIPMLPYSPNHRTNRPAASTVETIQLRRKVNQLEQKLSEKECQLLAAEKTAQQFHLQLNSTVDRMQSQIQQKDQAIQNVQNQLFERQLEVVSLQSLVKKSEVNMQASSMKVASLEEELNGLRSQVGTLLLLVQSQISGLQEEQPVETPPAAEEPPAFKEPVGMERPTVVEEFIGSNACDMPSTVDMPEPASSQEHDLEEEHIEATRRRYLAALIAARESPNEEMLALVAELRKELHALVMCPVSTVDTMHNGGQTWQSVELSMC